MKKLLTWAGILFFSLLFYLVSAVSAFAVQDQQAPSFPGCPNPGGSVLASYTDGTHGIPGGTSSAGSDSVYQTGENTVVQCLCNSGSGVQTNWWQIGDMSQKDIQSFVNQGWIYVPDGSAWGLASGPYLAQNIAGSCGGGNITTPTCTDQKPNGAPILLSAVAQGANSVKLTWTDAPDPVSYYLIAYGTEPGVYPYGNPNVGGQGTTIYTVNNLSGGVTYYFVVKAVNGCMPGPFSNELSSGANGGLVNGFALGFNVLGASDDPATPAAVLGVDIVNLPAACVRCFWWPILLIMALVLAIYYFAMRNRPFTKWRWIVGAAAGLVAYVIFVLLNRNCIDGVMDLKLFTLPCRLFWLLDLATYLTLATLFKWYFSKNK